MEFAADRVKIRLMRIGTLSVWCLLMVSTGEAQLVRDWRTVRTSHFELISRYDPAITGPLLTELEWARAVFESNFGLTSRLDRQTMLLIPDSIYEFEQLSPSKFADGFYLGAPWRDFILLRRLTSAREALLHEYTHLILHHEGGQWPTWFNEGSAEYYSTMRRASGAVEAGAPNSPRITVLRKTTWIPISYLTSVNGTSSLDSQQALQAFYAQSWLFVHMLHLSPAYAPGFANFRGLLAGGVASDQALQRVYGKSLGQFDEDARQWLSRGQFPVERLGAPAVAPASVESKIVSLADYDVASLTVATSRIERSEAQAGYFRLAKTAARSCDMEAALGDLAFATNLFRQASEHYRAALQCSGNTAGLAQGLEMALSYRQDLRRDELEEVVKLTGSGRSHFLFGTGLFFDQDYAGALRELEQAVGLSAADEFRATRIQSLALARLKRFDEALKMAGKLTGLARDVHERQSAALTIQDVERERKSAEAPIEPLHKRILKGLTRVDGELIRVDCLGNQARFWVRAGSETKKLLIADPGDVVSETGAQIEFACGDQRRAITIGYREQNDAATGTIGRIGYLEMH